METKDQVNLFIKLGLSLNQAKAYLALAKYSIGTASQISKIADLPTEIIYRTMPKLQEKGLIEKVLSTPAKFRATPTKLAIELLLERRKRENNQIIAKSNEFIEAISQIEPETTSNETRTVLIPERERLIQFLTEELVTIKRNLKMVMTSQKFSGWILACNKQIREALEKKITINAVVGQNTEPLTTRTLLEFMQHSNFTIKITSEPITAAVAIYDDQGAIIATEVNSAFAKSPAYWSNNPSIVALCQTYFATCWNNETTNQENCKHIAEPQKKESLLIN